MNRTILMTSSLTWPSSCGSFSNMVNLKSEVKMKWRILMKLSKVQFLRADWKGAPTFVGRWRSCPKFWKGNQRPYVGGKTNCHALITSRSRLKGRIRGTRTSPLPPISYHLGNLWGTCDVERLVAHWVTLDTIRLKFSLTQMIWIKSLHYRRRVCLAVTQSSWRVYSDELSLLKKYKQEK